MFEPQVVPTRKPSGEMLNVLQRAYDGRTLMGDRAPGQSGMVGRACTIGVCIRRAWLLPDHTLTYAGHAIIARWGRLRSTEVCTDV